MKFAPPFLHELADEVQPGSDGTSHCVSQTRSVSLSGDTGAVVLRLATFIVTRRQGVFAGWQGIAFLPGQLTCEERMSRFGMVALVAPRASYVASFPGSVAELSRMASPLIC